MEDKIKNLLSEYLSKTLGKKKEEIEPLLTEEKISEALPALLSWDAARVDVFKKKETEGFERGYKKANGEVLSKFEKELKEKYELDSSKTGIELIDELVSAQKGSTKITDEAVKSHQLYLDLESRAKKQEKAIEAEWKAKIEALQGEYKRKEVNSYVLKEALAHLDTLSPVLPEEDAKKANQLKWFEAEVLGLNWEIKENQDGTKMLIPLDKEGKRIENEQGYPRDAKDIFTASAEKFWSFSKTQKRSSGAPPAGGGAGAAGKKTWEGKIQLNKPSNQQELAKALDSIRNHPELTVMEKTEAQIALADMMES